MLTDCIRAVVLGAALSACAGQSGAIASAAVNSAIAVGTAAARREAGECYTVCPDGTSCNRTTGLCEVLPCRGRCMADEECIHQPGGLEQCVRKTLTPLRIETRPAQPPPAPRPTPPPSDAPTAESDKPASP